MSKKKILGFKKHKINALKKGYTPEEAEKIASICRSYYKSIDKMQAELSEKSMKIHEIFNEQSVKKGSWQQKYLTDFDKYVSKCRYCLNSGLDLPDEPLFTDYVPDLIPVEEELNQESAAAGMTLEEYIKKESSNTYYSYVLDKKKNAQDSYFTIEYLKQ